jgi:hypothetical protein
VKKFFSALFAIVVALVFSQVASAQYYNFNFSVSGSGSYAGATGSGELYVSSGVVVDLTGTFSDPGLLLSDQAMTLVPYMVFAQNDNGFTYPDPSSQYVDYNGLSFSVDSGAYDFNLFGNGPGSGDFLVGIPEWNDGSYYNDPTTLNVGVPEGGVSSLYLLLGGICCFGAIFASRKQFGSRA